MDQDTPDVVAALCTQAAMIMEDVLDQALTLGHADPAERGAHLLELRHASERFSKLIEAALALES